MIRLCDKADLKWQKLSLDKFYLMYIFVLCRDPSANVKEVGFRSYAAASHQGAI